MRVFVVVIILALGGVAGVVAADRTVLHWYPSEEDRESDAVSGKDEQTRKTIAEFLEALGPFENESRLLPSRRRGTESPREERRLLTDLIRRAGGNAQTPDVDPWVSAGTKLQSLCATAGTLGEAAAARAFRLACDQLGGGLQRFGATQEIGALFDGIAAAREALADYY